MGLIDLSTFIGNHILSLLLENRCEYIEIDTIKKRDLTEAIEDGLGIIDMYNPSSQLFDCFSREGNRAIQNLKRISSYGFIDSELEKYIEQIPDDYPGRHDTVGEMHSDSLHTILQRWWAAQPRAVIINYTPAGYHPNDCQDVKSIIGKMSERGTGFLLILSEMSDGKDLCDRIAIIDSEGGMTYV